MSQATAMDRNRSNRKIVRRRRAQGAANLLLFYRTRSGASVVRAFATLAQAREAVVEVAAKGLRKAFVVNSAADNRPHVRPQVWVLTFANGAPVLAFYRQVVGEDVSWALLGQLEVARCAAGAPGREIVAHGSEAYQQAVARQNVAAPAPVEAPAPAEDAFDGLFDLTVKQLRVRARAAGVKGYGDLRKKELAAAVFAAEEARADADAGDALVSEATALLDGVEADLGCPF